MGDYGKSALVDRRIPPLSVLAFVKAFPASRQLIAYRLLALTLPADAPSLSPNPLAASCFQTVAASAVVRCTESCLAHHRTEEIGGGPWRADLVELGVVEPVGGVDVVDGGGEVDDAPRAGRAY